MELDEKNENGSSRTRFRRWNNKHGDPTVAIERTDQWYGMACTYRYDRKGNWTHRVVYELVPFAWPVPKLIRTDDRVIEYWW